MRPCTFLMSTPINASLLISVYINAYTKLNKLYNSPLIPDAFVDAVGVFILRL